MGTVAKDFYGKFTKRGRFYLQNTKFFIFKKAFNCVAMAIFVKARHIITCHWHPGMRTCIISYALCCIYIGHFLPFPAFYGLATPSLIQDIVIPKCFGGRYVSVREFQFRHVDLMNSILSQLSRP